MSLMQDIHDSSGLPGSILAVLVALLLLLAGIIWVAFCIAVHRAALRVAEIKRQRRRQHIIEAALNRAMNQTTVPSIHSGIQMHFPADPVIELSPSDLPTYEEALQVQPPPPWAKSTNRSRVLTGTDTIRTYATTGHLRVAPERPATSAVARTVEDADTISFDPPSYETAIRADLESQM